MERIRQLQDKTGGFRAFITWSFQPGNTELGGEKTSGWDYMRNLAITRLYMDNVPHPTFPGYVPCSLSTHPL